MRRWAVLKPNKSFVLGCFFGVLLVVGGSIASTVAAYPFLKQYAAHAAGKRLQAPKLASGFKADYAWTVDDLDGKSLNVADFKGKVLFLSFWNPECVACVSEIPALNRLYDQVGADGVQMLGVAVDHFNDLAKSVREENIRFPVYALKGARPECFKSENSPATFIVDAGGDIVLRKVGNAKWDDDSVVSFLRMLAHSTPATP
jgi:peroxiredoxin